MTFVIWIFRYCCKSSKWTHSWLAQQNSWSLRGKTPPAALEIERCVDISHASVLLTNWRLSLLCVCLICFTCVQEGHGLATQCTEQFARRRLSLVMLVVHAAISHIMKRQLEIVSAAEAETPGSFPKTPTSCPLLHWTFKWLGRPGEVCSTFGAADSGSFCPTYRSPSQVMSAKV